MKNYARKLLALLLAACLFVSVLPAVSAYDLKVAPINAPPSCTVRKPYCPILTPYLISPLEMSPILSSPFVVCVCSYCLSTII